MVDSGELVLDYDSPAKKTFNKVCKYCGMPFESTVRNRIYCGDVCSGRAAYEKQLAKKAAKKKKEESGC